MATSLPADCVAVTNAHGTKSSISPPTEHASPSTSKAPLPVLSPKTPHNYIFSSNKQQRTSDFSPPAPSPPSAPNPIPSPDPVKSIKSAKQTKVPSILPSRPVNTPASVSPVESSQSSSMETNSHTGPRSAPHGKTGKNSPPTQITIPSLKRKLDVKKQGTTEAPRKRSRPKSSTRGRVLTSEKPTKSSPAKSSFSCDSSSSPFEKSSPVPTRNSHHQTTTPSPTSSLIKKKKRKTTSPSRRKKTFKQAVFSEEGVQIDPRCVDAKGRVAGGFRVNGALFIGPRYIEEPPPTYFSLPLPALADMITDRKISIPEDVCSLVELEHQRTMYAAVLEADDVKAFLLKLGTDPAAHLGDVRTEAQIRRLGEAVDETREEARRRICEEEDWEWERGREFLLGVRGEVLGFARAQGVREYDMAGLLVGAGEEMDEGVEGMDWIASDDG